MAEEMNWADEIEHRRWQEKNGPRERARAVNPHFIEIVDAVLASLLKGIRKTYPRLTSDSIKVDPASGIQVERGIWSPTNTLKVEVEYSQFRFKVTCSSESAGIWKDLVKHVRAHHPQGVVTEEFVDRICREIVKDYISRDGPGKIYEQPWN